MALNKLSGLRAALLALAAFALGAGRVCAGDSAREELGVRGGSGIMISAPRDYGAAASGRAAGEAAYDASLSAGPRRMNDLTVMIYMNGKNNLDRFHFSDLNAISAVAVNGRMDIVIEKGSLGASDPRIKSYKGSRRYEVRRRNIVGHARLPRLVAEFPAVDMGDWRHALDFLQWAKREYPARRYVFIISDHGSGLFDPKKSDAGAATNPGSGAGGSAKAISFDEQTGNFITNQQLGQLLRDAGGVDVFVMDACLMQAAEIAYEVKNYTPFVVASEETSWTSTLAYYDALTQFTYNTAMQPEDLAKQFVASSARLWPGANVHQSLSVIRTAELGGLVSRLDRFAELAEVLDDTAAVKAARAKVMRFQSPWSEDKKQFSPYGDLHSFVKEYLRALNLSRPGAADVLAAGTAVMAHIEGPLMAANGTFGKDSNGTPMYNARGVSIYVPPAKYPMAGEGGTIVYRDARPSDQAAFEAAVGNDYGQFAFSAASRWDTFVNYLWSVP